MSRHEKIELPKGIFNLFKRRRLKKSLDKKLGHCMIRILLRSEPREKYSDGWHKIHILSTLLKRGYIDKDALLERLCVLPEFNAVLFERAWAVIFAYVYGASSVLLGGTGLPE